MKKIPVSVSIAGAYRFAFERFLGNLGVIWVPVLLVMVGSWYFLPLIAAAASHNLALTQGHQAGPADAMRQFLAIYRAMAIFWIVVILIRAEMMLGLTERALGTAKGPSFVYLSVGRDYWRVAGSYFAVALILLTAYVVLAIAGTVLGVVGGLAGHAAGSGKGALALGIALGLGIAFVVIFLPIIYLGVRLTFFLTVAIVDEGKFDLMGPWRLAGGNFWRIFAVGLAVFVPAGLVMLAAFGFLEAGVFEAYFLHMPPPGSHDPAAIGRALQEMGASMHTLMRQRWYIFLPLALVASALLYGLATGASVTAYRALVPEPAAQPD